LRCQDGVGEYEVCDDCGWTNLFKIIEETGCIMTENEDWKKSFAQYRVDIDKLTLGSTETMVLNEILDAVEVLLKAKNEELKIAQQDVAMLTEQLKAKDEEVGKLVGRLREQGNTTKRISNLEKQLEAKR